MLRSMWFVIDVAGTTPARANTISTVTAAATAASLYNAVAAAQ